MIYRLLFSLGMLAAILSADPTVVRCGKLIDVRSGSVKVDAAVVVNNGRIVEVGAASTTAIAGAPVVDLTSATCMPGLIDVHDHLTSDARIHGYKSLGISVPRATLTGARNAKVTLRAGFTTVRNVGASGYSDVALRDAINDGDVEGPEAARVRPRAWNYRRPLR